MVLAPGGEVAHKAAVGVCSIHTRVPPHFLEIHRVDGMARGPHFVEPAFEAQEAHPAAFEALRAEAFRAAGEAAVGLAQRPAGGGAQIEGEEGCVH